MGRWIALLLVAFTLISTPVFPQEKKRDWRTGRLISIEEPALDSAAIIREASPARIIFVKYKIWIYRVSSDSTTWVFVTGGKGHEHARPFTTGRDVRFALDSKGNAFLIDDDGKELKALEAFKAVNRARAPSP